MQESQSSNKLTLGYNYISDNPIEVPAFDRSYQKYDIVQQDVIEGTNKTIKSVDKDGLTRIFIGYKEDVEE